MCRQQGSHLKTLRSLHRTHLRTRRSTRHQTSRIHSLHRIHHRQHRNHRTHNTLRARRTQTLKHAVIHLRRSKSTSAIMNQYIIHRNLRILQSIQRRNHRSSTRITTGSNQRTSTASILQKLRATHRTISRNSHHHMLSNTRSERTLQRIIQQGTTMHTHSGLRDRLTQASTRTSRQNNHSSIHRR